MRVIEDCSTGSRELCKAPFIKALIDRSIWPTLAGKVAVCIALLASDRHVLADSVTATGKAPHAIRPAERFEESKALFFGPKLLLDLPEDAAFSSHSGQAFVTLPRLNQTFALSDHILHDWFRDRYYRNNGQPLSGQDLHQTLATLRARAHCSARRCFVGIRAAGTSSAIYIDLCNKDSESVAITKA